MAEAEADVKEKQTSMFKKFGKKSFASRKRRETDSDKDSSDDAESQVVRKEKKARLGNPLVQKSTLASKSKAEVAGSDSSDQEVSTVGVSYKSKGAVDPSARSDMGATATLETETELSKDAQAIFERSLAVNKELKGKEDDKIYRGMNNYAQYYEKKDTAQGNAASGSVRKGPIRAPANLRATVRWDYQPDICKDFKETGYCGFGDSCKFLHDRSDYKFGWQLEREMADGTYGDGDEDPSKYEIDSDEEQLPFKCLICRNSFKDPVVTKCKHYFCEKCALEHYKKTTRCQACNAQTGGVFCPAREIIKRMKGETACGGSHDHDDPEEIDLASDPESSD